MRLIMGTYITLIYLYLPVIFGQNLPTKVDIILPDGKTVADVGDSVKLICDFNLTENAGGITNDLAILQWEKKSGDLIFKYNHQVGQKEEKHEDYEDKITETNYEVLAGSARRHTLTLNVDNCDTAVFTCRLYNQNDITEGRDEKRLDVKSNIPAPELCWNVDSTDVNDGPMCYNADTSGAKIESLHNVTKKVNCSVKNTSINPGLSLRQEDVDPVTGENFPQLPKCLYNGSVEMEAVIGTVDVKITCTVNYAGTEKTVQITVGPEKNIPAGGVTGDNTVAVAVGSVVAIAVVFLVILFVFCILTRRRRKGEMNRSIVDDTDSEKLALNGLKNSEVSNGTIIAFRYSTSEFSNIYKANIKIQGVNGVFNCPEQFRYYRTAELAGDKEAMEEVMNATDVKEMRRITKDIQLPGEKRNSATIEALQRAMKAKFIQHENLRKKLLDTGDKVLAETGRPDDTYYSIGLTSDHEHLFVPDKWPGQNISGILLRKVREELRNVEV